MAVSSWTELLGPRARFVITISAQKGPLTWALSEPPIGIEPMTYASRACFRALLVASKHVQASSSQIAAGGDRWLLTAVRGLLGDTLRAGPAFRQCLMPHSLAWSRT